MNKITYKNVLRPLSKALLCAAMLSTLSGCVGMVVGGAVAGVVANADRRTLGAQTDDKAIGIKADMRLSKALHKDTHVNVNSFNRKVLLTGEVNDEAAKATAEREVRAIDGVLGVSNELEIGSPATYTSRSNDSYITTKVKASLVEEKSISATAFKVVTERGTVFLLGRVTQREGLVAGEVARGVGGVQRVVKNFEYISEDEMRALSPATSSVQL